MVSFPIMRTEPWRAVALPAMACRMICRPDPSRPNRTMTSPGMAYRLTPLRAGTCAQLACRFVTCKAAVGILRLLFGSAVFVLLLIGVKPAVAGRDGKLEKEVETGM